MTPSFQDLFSQANVDEKTAISPYRLKTLETTEFNPSDTRPNEAETPNPRIFTSVIGQPCIDTGNIIFDGLYSLALNEMADNAVCKIKDTNFNKGNEFRPDNFPFGSLFFQAGTSWTYVWTRDTAYSVDLALAALSPEVALNSLMFKTSLDRNGNNKQIVQDTGTGGSYPISSDRVVWALAAQKLLHYLSEEEKLVFQNEAFEIVKNTIEHDRQVLFDKDEEGLDKVDGLYSGEQSFLDWRQQTYPGWVAYDVVHVGMSKCLSTNLLHLNILNLGANLANKNKANDLAQKYQNWADNLKQAIRDKLYLSDTKLYSTFITTFLDSRPAHQYDLLGSVLAILLDVATPEQSKDIIANYPVLPYGPPVIWPQQQLTKIYHNRAIWPFVTAYWIKAAKKVGNVDAVNHGVKSLIQGVIRYRSNRENFEMVEGKTWVGEEDKMPQEFPQINDNKNNNTEMSTSGPAVCSQAQLWSVAGYLSMVHDVIFGLDTSNEGIRFLPYVTTAIRREVFGKTNSLTLKNFQYQGKTIDVTVNLPDVISTSEGRYQIDSIKLNDQMVSQADQEMFIQPDQLQSSNRIEIQLSSILVSTGSDSSIKLITDTAYQNLFAPKCPIITGIDLTQENYIQIFFHANGENTEDIAFNIYRDGQLVKENIPGSQTVWIDPNTDKSSQSYCYTVESYFHKSNLAIKNYSQISSPFCYWGINSQRIKVFEATKDLKHYGKDNSRAQESSRHGYSHYENWGNSGDTLVLESFKPTQTGSYLLQVSAANGAGALNTGITCAVKYLQVLDQANICVGNGYLIMPHTLSWDDLKDSSFVRVDNLESSKNYRVVIGDNEHTFNMSYFDHFRLYNGTGGSGSYNNVNIASLKILALTA